MPPLKKAHWVKVGQDERVQRSSLCASIVGDTVYVFGGELKPRLPRDDDVYKLGLSGDGRPSQVQRVERVANARPQARVGSASTALNGKIYMFSGRGGEAMAPIDENGRLWVFDSRDDTWSTVTPNSSEMPEPRSYHCMTSNKVDTIYLHAGCPETGRLSDLWAFDITASKWERLASAPDPPRGGPSIAFVNGKLYRMNGFDGKTEQGGKIDIYDPTSDSWSTTSFVADGVSGPGARSVSALLSVVVDGTEYLATLFGESDPSSLGHQGAGKMLSDAWAFSLRENAWSKIDTGSGDAPDPRGWFDADVVSKDDGDAIVVVGGLGESNNRLDDVWLLNFG